MTADIMIVGLGITSVDHCTRETERVLRGCREVLYVDTSLGTDLWLASLCDRVTPLYSDSYLEGRSRLAGYHHMAACTIAAAMDHAPVAFAMFGHPTVGVYAPFLITELAGLLGLTVRILPGVSAMDCLFAELGLDPCVQGIQMVEATDLLLRDRPLQPDMPTLIWQAGNLETRLHTSRRSLPKRLHRFVSRLLRTWPPDHPVTMYYAGSHPLIDSVVEHVRLADLPEHAGALHPGVTLYLPATGWRPIADPDLAGKLDDPAHLASLTR